MHELGITQSIVEFVSERAAGQRVKRVTLEIGQLCAVLPEALRFCFDLCCEGTSLEGAELCIIQVEGRGRCEVCGETLPLPPQGARCACGSFRIVCVAGQELNIKEMELS